MLLVFEIGNSKINVAIFKDEEIFKKWKIIDSSIQTIEDFDIIFKKLLSLERIELTDITDVVISSVVPEIQKIIKSFLKLNNMQYLSLDNEKINFNITSPAKDIKEIGKDILANITAGKERFKENFVIIDLGTAITFDIVGKAGVHIGEVIVPGIILATRALNEHCISLPKIKFIEPQDNIIGKSTIPALNGGIFYGYIGMITNIVEKIRTELDFEPRFYMTGGLAELLINDLPFVSGFYPNLTVEGVKLIWEKNKGLKDLD